MAVKFIEPGGDADFGVGLWSAVTGDSGKTPSASSTVVHGFHQRSISYSNSSVASSAVNENAVLADSGGRVSLYIYFTTLPAITSSYVVVTQASSGPTVIRIRITSGGVLQLWDSAAQKGSNGSTLSTGVWYRLCLAWTITSSTVNQITLFKNGVSDIALSNVTLTNVSSSDLHIGNGSADTSVVFYTSDHYVDNNNSVTDTGDIWVTAKRPTANGTNVQFTTQIGSGGSGYGSGHSPQVNERPESDTNGWSITTTAIQTEEYNIESMNTGDMDISAGTTIDYMGWIRTAISSTTHTPTDHIIVNGTATAVTLTTSAAYYTQIAGSTVYPAGTGADIGMDGSWASTGGTISLYECGIIVAFIPGRPPVIPFRIPNKFVGPMALRYNFKQPYYPVGVTAVQATLGPDTDVTMWGAEPNQPIINYYKTSVTDY